MPIEKKIKVATFSDNIDPQEKNSEDFEKAVIEAKANGISILFCEEFEIAVAKPLSDRDNPKNYYHLNLVGTAGKFEDNKLYVPTDRTTASNSDDYIKWGVGGLSWTTPYITGLMAIGWQINPNLTAEELLDYMYKSATKMEGVNRGGLINPKEFVKTIQYTKVDLEKTNYNFFLYNSESVTEGDLLAIKEFALTAPINEEVEYFDVKGLDSASQIYAKLKEFSSKKKGKLSGIQIFGMESDVPAFNVEFRIQMKDGVDNAGNYVSDYFYSNFNNDLNKFSNLSVYSNFKDNLSIDFNPQWPVVRLPLEKGEYAHTLKNIIAT